MEPGDNQPAAQRAGGSEGSVRQPAEQDPAPREPVEAASSNRRPMPSRAIMAGAAAALLVLLAVLLLLPAATAQPTRIPRVGFLALGTQGRTGDVGPFQQGMKDLGYVEGQNVVVEYRFADGQAERLPELANELVNLGMNVIVATSSPAIRAAQEATQTIPIVMGISADPVEQGFVASLARPGGNITGLTSMSLQLSAKRLELLKETVPTATRLALLWDPAYPGKSLEFQEMQEASGVLGVRLQSLEARSPGDFEGAFEAAVRERAEGVVVIGGPMFFQNHAQIARLAQQHGLVSMYETAPLIRGGGVLGYGPSNDDLFYRSAYFVDRIVKGAKPADLPVERPTRFYLGINLQTAQTLGITIPSTLLLDASEIVR